jgi:hypothetical protein
MLLSQNIRLKKRYLHWINSLRQGLPLGFKRLPIGMEILRQKLESRSTTRRSISSWINAWTVPPIASILERAGISRSAYTTAVTKLDELGLLPDWCKIQRKNHPERIVRDRLQAQLGGKVEAYTKFGLIDLLTETELIEIKIVNRWKDAIGHILAKSEKYPNHQKRLHLFGYQEPILENIEEVCDRLGIRVTFEMVEKLDRALVIA